MIPPISAALSALQDLLRNSSGRLQRPSRMLDSRSRSAGAFKAENDTSAALTRARFARCKERATRPPSISREVSMLATGMFLLGLASLAAMWALAEGCDRL